MGLAGDDIVSLIIFKRYFFHAVKPFRREELECCLDLPMETILLLSMFKIFSTCFGWLELGKDGKIDMADIKA